MIKITKRQSNYLNRKIREVEDAEKHDLFLVELAAAGKVIPYIGQDWHDVDFTKVIEVGHCIQFVGFLEDNKWNYPIWPLTEEQDDTLKAMLLDLDLSQNKDVVESDLQEIYTYMQSCCPEGSDVIEAALRAISLFVDDPILIEGGIHVRRE